MERSVIDRFDDHFGELKTINIDWEMMNLGFKGMTHVGSLFGCFSKIDK